MALRDSAHRGYPEWPRSPYCDLSCLPLAASIEGAADDLLEPFDNGLAHPVLDMTEVPAEPADLIGQDFVDGLNESSSTLRELVADL